ncbi:MAG: twitching motility protein PilT [Candidatus Entotheonella gemina]|uniref:Twitching motility protein PilT n=1 Tax=Candidatus Entotheonella gemina TaxID=1429439 RepID=W4MG72_9BACT|nr:MAG: twitching motility protein PilT [Candidatus Entotheonella gemina]
MMLPDTHIWLWWIHDPSQLTQLQVDSLHQHENDVIGVSIFSCWEIAKLVQLQRLDLPRSLREWITLALGYPGIRLFQLTPDIVIESTQLPGMFHRDPADQIIVVTARVHGCPLVTSDRKISQYPYVETIA